MLCFLDMDGVIVDLHQVIFRDLGLEGVARDDFNQGCLKRSPEELWSHTNEEWWEALPWTSDGRELLDIVENHFGQQNVVICTKPAPWPGSAEGKLRWIRRHIPQYSTRFILTPEKHWCASHRTVLIDDTDHNCRTFREAGGLSVLVPRPWNAGEGTDPIYHLSFSLTFLLGSMP